MNGFLQNKVNVEYSVGDSIKIKADVTQEKLAELLKNPEVCLLYVNKPKTAYRPRKRK